MKKISLVVAALLALSCTVAQAVVFSGAMDNRAGLPYVPGFTAQSLAWIVGGSRGEGLRLEWQADDQTNTGFWTYTYTLVRGTARNKGFAYFDIETAADFAAGNISTANPPVVTATTSTGIPVSGSTTPGPVEFNEVHDFGIAGSNETNIATLLNKADLSHYSGDPGRSAAGLHGGEASATPTEGPVAHPFFGMRVTFPGTFDPASAASLAYVASDWQIQIVSNRVPMWGSFFGWGDQTFIPPFWYSNFYNDNIGPPETGQPPIERLSLAPVNSLIGSDPYRGWILVPGPLPAVLATNPVDTAIDVPASQPVSQPVTAVFGGLMDPASITAATFTLSTGSVPVTGSVSYDAASLTATFTPAVPLVPATTYSATISSGAIGVKDLAGNPLAADKVWSFTTTADDVIPPTVTSQFPPEAARNVALNTTITAVFSEAIDSDPDSLSTASFRVADGSGPLSGTVAYNPATRTATFTPTALLVNNTVYTATISIVVRDLAGNTLAQDTIWSFTTIPQETVLPVITSTVPSDQAGNVSVFNPITATFSEAMDPATINGTNFTIAGVTGTVSLDGATRIASFTPDVPLTNSTTYTAKITTAVKDLSGNAIPLEKIWTFTTGAPDLIPPTVTGTQPTAAVINVPLVTTVSVSFSEQMNPATIGPASFTLTGQTFATSEPFAVIGTVSYTNISTSALFSPNAPLVMGTTYTATITTAATDLAGNALATEKKWSFFTLPDGILIPGETASTIADALKVLRIVVSLDTASPDDRIHGDVAPLGLDGKPQPDGQITIQDALIILRKVVGLVSW